MYQLILNIIFGILFIVIGTFMESVLKVKTPQAYAIVYALIGFTFGLLMKNR